jgi:hypothetical protein
MPYPIERLFKSLGSTWPSALVALAAWISIVIAIDPAGSYPSLPEGPGLTIDEFFNVEQGVYLVEQSRMLGWLNLAPTTSMEAFRPENGYNPDHPPLGRYWLGLHHHIAWWIAPPHEPAGFYVTACARTGSATAFALTVWLVGSFSMMFFTTWAPANGQPGPSGQIVGGLASLALVMMPRLYGHAHLASLETITNLTCTAVVLVIAAGWANATPPGRIVAMVSGVVMGLALLTKIQAILIPIPVIVWALLRWRHKALVPLLIWGLTALGVFFLLWPYLWLDPVGHLLEYLGRTTHRVTLYCYYFGVRYADKAVPWHYPFVMFAVTIPLGLHLLGVIAVGSLFRTCKVKQAIATSGAGHLLVLSCVLFPLLVFAMPGVAVYDGERLFLTVFPLWAIFIGRGAALALEWASQRVGKPIATIAFGVAIVTQLSLNLLSHPVYLSYYNLMVGGVRGAESLGLEMNYWGDALTRHLLMEAVSEHEAAAAGVADWKQPARESVEIRPSLHRNQAVDLVQQSPLLRKIFPDGPTASAPGAKRLRLMFRRRADLSDDEFWQTGEPAGQPSHPRLATYQWIP